MKDELMIDSVPAISAGNRIKIERYTAADAFMEAFEEAGVKFIFSNLGSDHPTIIESLAKADVLNLPMPEIILCPHESVALSAAQGYTQVTGEPQAVFVHLDVGTQNLGGAVHNVFRARIPVLIFAGDTPYTVEGELQGSRNTPINFLQDIFDQRSIVRPYVKWEYELRTGKNVKQLLYRALQIAQSDPKGPVYLMGAREVLEEEISPVDIPYNGWSPIEPTAIPESTVKQLAEDLVNAKNPIIITSYLGRNHDAVAELVKLSDKLTIPVIEVSRSYVNFPSDHPLHLGFVADAFVPEADMILVLDCDVPWIPSKVNPAANSKVYYIDIDPLKETIPVWYKPSQKFVRADSLVALQQINAQISESEIETDKKNERYSRLHQIHKNQRQEWKRKETLIGDVITPEWLTACLNEVIDEDTIVLNETITNDLAVFQHLPRTKPGTLFTSGATSLGWHGGAAIGAKLAKPDKTIVALTGDGSYLFSVPASVHWIAQKYNTPFLTIIYDNQGWNATKQNVLRLHPDGVANQINRFWVNFDSPSDLAGIAAAAGGAYARTVMRPDELNDALREGLKAVSEGRCAVIDVRIKPISQK